MSAHSESFFQAPRGMYLKAYLWWFGAGSSGVSGWLSAFAIVRGSVTFAGEACAAWGASGVGGVLFLLAVLISIPTFSRDTSRHVKTFLGRTS